ncbi:hypothetical protein BDD12DRAFT_945844 [Trichophaea hybrida]|nr:hypothetical protein BDD12DRAFT_945844 [Trichophaea hybrida]
MAASTMRRWFLLIVLTAPEVIADSGDDFVNNLVTDLAPLLALFGEQFAKQYLSQSFSLIDSIIFALAPLGIITAVVGAIRVGGPMWLKAAIGRARENRAVAELELMTSTSDEVGELWQDGAVVRLLGKPDSLQLIYFEKFRDDNETFGLFTVEMAEELGYIKSQHEEDSKIAQRDDQSSLPLAPNVLINLQASNKSKDLYFTAGCGLLLQVGVLLYSGMTVYNQAFKPNFSKDGRTVNTYAYPIMAIGTVTLIIGVALCSAVIEMSSTESEWVVQPSMTNSQPSMERSMNVRLLWLQRSNSVNSQNFDPVVMFAPDGPDHRTSIRTSGRAPTFASNTRAGDRTSRLESLTLLGTGAAVIGFILQFQGLRALHWSASIAQLVATALMTALRIWIRRRIVVQPAVVEVPDDHILDWLALRIGRSCGGVEDSSGFNFWPGRNETLQIESPLRWRIYTDDHNFAYSSGNKTTSQIMTAQYAANARRRLGRLTEWTGKATKPSIALSQSISVVMRILFGNDPNMSPFVWCLKVQVGDELQSIEFRVENIKGKWKADATKIEAALSLWMFHVWLVETRNGSNLKSNWVRKRTDAD